MWNAIGQVLPSAVGVALSPIPIIAVVLMLVSARGRVNGLVFVLGWLVGLAIVGAIVLAIAGPAASGDNGSPSTGASIFQIVLGGLLVVLAASQWRKRPRAGVEPASPKWMAAIDSFSPVKAAGMGALFAGLNPKNTLLAVGAAATIAQTGIAGGQQAVAYTVFGVVASIGVGAPVVISLAMGERAKVLLDGLEDWMAQNNAVIMAVLCLVIGAKLVGQGIAGF